MSIWTPAGYEAFGLTAAEISDQLRAKNIDMGGGAATWRDRNTPSALGSAADGRGWQTPILIGQGRTVAAGSAGHRQRRRQRRAQLRLLDGKPVVAFGVFSRQGQIRSGGGRRHQARVARIMAAHPGMQITLIDDATTHTSGSYRSTMDTLYEGAALAVIVVFLFLRNWRATMIAAVALPCRSSPTFFVMSRLGFTLNGISLLAITLVTGILVDDAIVEIENIVRHINMGVPAYRASMEAANEIGLTVIAISFSIIAVFAPVSFMGGIRGSISSSSG